MKKCRIDSQECDFRQAYRVVAGQKFMVKISVCRLSSRDGYYPTHTDHCVEQVG